MQLSENTVNGWTGVLADLAAKQQAARDHIARLRSDKQSLALESALGGGGDAKKRLDKVNAELSRLTLEEGDWALAISRAESEKSKAAQVEADAAEQARHAELRTLATAALRHAAQFTDGLRQAAQAGAALKMTIQNMLSRATTAESASLDRFLRAGGAWQRAAEKVGLRDFLEFQAYPGPREHVMPLEDELAARLSRWIEPTGKAS